MPRAVKGAARRQSKNRWFKAAKGNRNARRTNWRMVKQTVIRSGAHATEHRRSRKREYRNLWVIRINAAVAAHDMNYSRFIAGLKAADIFLNRKMLSQIAIEDPDGFAALVAEAKQALPAASSTVAA